jgi:hypothetical protein
MRCVIVAVNLTIEKLYFRRICSPNLPDHWFHLYPTHWVLAGIFPGIKRQELGTFHSSASVVKVKNEWPFCIASQVSSLPSKCARRQITGNPSNRFAVCDDTMYLHVFDYTLPKGVFLPYSPHTHTTLPIRMLSYWKDHPSLHLSMIKVGTSAL